MRLRAEDMVSLSSSIGRSLLADQDYIKSLIDTLGVQRGGAPADESYYEEEEEEEESETVGNSDEMDEYTQENQSVEAGNKRHATQDDIVSDE